MNQKQIVLQATLGFLTAVSLRGPIAGRGQQLQPIRVIGSSTPMAHRPAKNPKLSTQIADLARAVPQRATPLAPSEIVAGPESFSVAKLPKSARDAVKAGQMKVNDKGEVQVYIEVNEITGANLEQLKALGVTVQILGQPKPDKTKGEVLSAVPTVQSILPIAMINQVAALPFVRYIRLPDYGFTNTGTVDTQGDSILKANLVRQQFGVDGTGVRVGMISGGIGGIFATGCTTCGPTTLTPSPINTGDLPSATGTRNASGVLTSVSGGIIAESFRSDGDLEDHAQPDGPTGVNAEGAAMLEIVHDLAPNAQLYFANFDTGLSFEQAVNYLAANTDASVDDIGFPSLPPYDGTDPVSTNTAADLNNDANPIRGYFTAIGNLVFNHWGEPWTDSGTNATLSCPASSGGSSTSGDVQLFDATTNTKDANALGPSPANPLIVPNGAQVVVVLVWNDPFAGSSNDYDLYLYLAQGGSLTTPLACSVSPQTGTQPPVEAVSYQNTSGAAQEVGILVQNVNNTAAARNFDMFVFNSVTGNAQNLNFFTAAGSIVAEGDAGGSPVSVVSVGATDAQSDAQGNPPATVIEPYSSQGPTEGTPQAASRMKPDVTATDDVSVTGAGGFGSNGSNATATGSCVTGETPCSFAGTSAASPHAAGIAALLLQSAPCLLSSSTVNTPVQARTNLRSFITSTAVPLSGVSQPVPNNIEGFGLIDALAAAQKTLPTVNAGTSQTVNGTSASGAQVTLAGSATDPDNCPVTLRWSGPCGTATVANPSLTCPLGVDTETLTASNGGAILSLPANTVQIAVSDFTLKSAQPSASAPAGKSATYTINVSSKFGDFTNPTSLACSGLPSLSSCSFSPTSVTPGSGTAISTLTISTTAPSSLVRIVPHGKPGTPLYVLALGLIVLLAAVLGRKSRRKLGYCVASGALFISFLASLVACGGSGGGSATGSSHPGTPAGSYTVTVTGSSNQLRHSTTITLAVQ